MGKSARSLRASSLGGRRDRHDTIVPTGRRAASARAAATLDGMGGRLRRLVCSPRSRLALAGCSGGEEASDENLPGDALAGAQVFAEAGCDGCHALRAAGSQGGKGPNLDTLRPG